MIVIFIFISPISKKSLVKSTRNVFGLLDDNLLDCIDERDLLLKKQAPPLWPSLTGPGGQLTG